MAEVKEYTYRECYILCLLAENQVFTHYNRYDKLVIAVGSSSNTHCVPGLEHSFQLKTVRDAQSIRRRIMGKTFLSLKPACFSHVGAIDNFEAASQPTTTPEERKRLLSFVVCGGGPTGVETAAVCAILFLAVH
jgi:NADH dehydrogenase FAD-containing subunit